jgi:hypothetical protein
VAHDPFAHLNDNLTGWTNGFFMFRWRLSLTPQILATWFWSPSIFY